jgi:hypothetical protein
MPELSNITEDYNRYGTAEHDRLNQEASKSNPKAIAPQKYNNSKTSPFTAQVALGKKEFTNEIS